MCYDRYSIFLLCVCFTLQFGLQVGEGMSLSRERDPGWYRFPKIRRVPWGMNLEKVPLIDIDVDKDVESKTEEMPEFEEIAEPERIVVGEKVAEADTPTETHRNPVKMPNPKSKVDAKDCNCAHCAWRIKRKIMKSGRPVPVGGKKGRLFFMSPYYDYDYYDYDYDYPYYGGGGYGGGGYGGYGGGGYGPGYGGMGRPPFW